MIALELLRWWYTRGWQQIARNASGQLGALMDVFSVSILLRTLFSPWRRILSYPGAGLDAKMRAMLDNLVSRAVGFVVRLLALFAFIILAVLLAIFGIFQIILWPFIPLLIPASIVKGIL